MLWAIVLSESGINGCVNYSFVDFTCSKEEDSDDESEFPQFSCASSKFEPPRTDDCIAESECSPEVILTRMHITAFCIIHEVCMLFVPSIHPGRGGNDRKGTTGEQG